MTTLIDAQRAAAAFCLDGTSCAVSPLGSGNINDTFLVASISGPFVLQRINRRVFIEPLRVINNFAEITRHLAGRSAQTGQRFRTAQPVPTRDGALFFRDRQGEYWRAQTYLAHNHYQNLTDPGQAFQLGKALAHFHYLMADLDGQALLDPLPGFHNLPLYLQEFDQLLNKTTNHSDAANDYCLTAIGRGRLPALSLEEARSSGLLTLQVIHGDPKIDNFLFDDHGLACGIFDLDTVGAGIVHYDLGDCLRSCCNRGGESGKEQSDVLFDIKICRALMQGYFCEPHGLLNAGQRAKIFDAVLAITFELGLRFFTDHLRGNSYFKVRHDGENLARAVRQFRLLEDIVAQERQIRALTVSAGTL